MTESNLISAAATLAAAKVSTEGSVSVPRTASVFMDMLIAINHEYQERKGELQKPRD